MAGGLPSSGPSFSAPGHTVAITSGVRRSRRWPASASACEAPSNVERSKAAPTMICRKALFTSMGSSRLDGAVLNVAACPVEHGVLYIIFVFLIPPGLDGIKCVGRAAALRRTIQNLHGHKKIVAFFLVQIRIHVLGHIHACGWVIQDKGYG